MMNQRISCIVFLPLITVSSKVYDKFDLRKPNFDITALDVLSVVERNSTSCLGTMEKVTAYRYNWRHSSGEVVKDQINIVEETDLTKETYSEVLVSDPSIKGISKSNFLDLLMSFTILYRICDYQKSS